MKKIISLIVIIVILITGFAYASGDTTIKDAYDEGYNDGYNDGKGESYKPRVPKLIILEDNEIIEAKAGEYLDLSFTYKNVSEYSAYDIKITPIFENSILEYEKPISYSSEAGLRKDKERVANFNLKINPSTKIGIYELKFKIEYQNNNDENHSTIESVFVRVTEEKLKSILTIDNVTTIPEKVSAGEKFTLKFNINNIGQIKATDLSVKLNNLTKDTFMAVDAKDYDYIGTINSESSISKEFQMIAAEDITKGNHSLGVTINYKDSNGKDVSEEKTLYILDVISNKEDKKEESSSKPKIIIESYSTNPSKIIAGDTINFAFNFKNTSNEKTISNMKITLSSDNGAFMITKGSNTFYIEELKPKESAIRNIELNVKQDLTSSSYPINIEFDYEDSSNDTHLAKEVINLPVTEFSKLVINSAYASETMFGSQTSLSFDYINMGKAKVSNLTASVEGDFTSVESINYIGNLEAGNSDYYDIMVTPNKEGELHGTLVLSFEDSSGKPIEVRKDFTSYAMPAFVPDDSIMAEPGFYDPMIEEPILEEKMEWWQIALCGFGSFLVTFIITKIITVKIVRKKLEDEI